MSLNSSPVKIFYQKKSREKLLEETRKSKPLKSFLINKKTLITKSLKILYGGA